MSEREPSPRLSRSPATSLVTWGLALVFLVGIDAAITRTSILWGPTAFENSGGIRTVMPQTYQVLRKIYAPDGDPDQRVVLLGNSRLALSIEGQGVERALAEGDATREIAVENLAIFGAYVGDTAVLARHLGALDPDLVILTLGGMEVSRTATNPDARGPASLLEIGWADVSVTDPTWGERIDRWLRTGWPLYRFREFAREAILDRVLQRPDPGPPPGHFETKIDLFRHLYGDRAEAVAAAHERFLASRSLKSFTDYVKTVGPEHLERQRERVRNIREIHASSPTVATLDRLLGELAAAHERVLVLLMPENPILVLDEKSEYHRADVLDEAARIVAELGTRHGVTVVDGRDWLPVECFLDFHHPLFEPHHFEERIAREILDALES